MTLIKRLKAKIKELAETRVLGSKLNEWRWKGRHEKGGNDWGDDTLRGEKDEWVLSYWKSKDHPHRSFVVERIARFSPQSILEIGANCGPNLYLLAKKFPHANIHGIDINPQAIDIGKHFFAKEGITNVTLSEARAGDLAKFPDNSFDVVFTDAVLIYVGPDKIKKVAKEMLRVACQALVLLEWECEKGEKDPLGVGIYYGGKWKRDYKNLFSPFIAQNHIHRTKLPLDVWPDKNWRKLGYLIEVIK